MPAIPDLDRTIFSNAEKTILDDFTETELDEIHETAIRLDAILNKALTRQKSRAQNVPLTDLQNERFNDQND